MCQPIVAMGHLKAPCGFLQKYHGTPGPTETTSEVLPIGNGLGVGVQTCSKPSKYGWIQLLQIRPLLKKMVRAWNARKKIGETCQREIGETFGFVALWSLTNFLWGLPFSSGDPKNDKKKLLVYFMETPMKHPWMILMGVPLTDETENRPIHQPFINHLAGPGGWQVPWWFEENLKLKRTARFGWRNKKQGRLHVYISVHIYTFTNLCISVLFQINRSNMCVCVCIYIYTIHHNSIQKLKMFAYFHQLY